MSVQFPTRVEVPATVLVRTLEEESVLLDLATEQYYGLDRIGTRMLDVLTRTGSVEAAFSELLDEFEVDPAVLRKDIGDLTEQLVARGLLQVPGE